MARPTSLLAITALAGLALVEMIAHLLPWG